MKIERSNKQWGSGFGKPIFESNLFKVSIWESNNHGFYTKLKNKISDIEINFEGKQYFLTDEECIEQFTEKEILDMLEFQKVISFHDGMKNKITQIKEILEL